MEVIAILNQCEEYKAKLIPEGDNIRVKAPAPLPDDLRTAIKSHKTAIITYLKLKGYIFTYPGNPHDIVGDIELKEIEYRVNANGYVLLWSNLLHDLIAFYRDTEELAKIPPGFIPYSISELNELFGTSSPDDNHLKLVHRAKKEAGARIIKNKPCYICGSTQRWITPDGRELCSRCHPNPNKAGEA